MGRREDYDDEEWAERVERFADPHGDSALHVARKGNPRNRSCPTCKTRNVLTPADIAAGYQCNACANRAERGFDY